MKKKIKLGATKPRKRKKLRQAKAKKKEDGWNVVNINGTSFKWRAR